MSQNIYCVYWKGIIKNFSSYAYHIKNTIEPRDYVILLALSSTFIYEPILMNISIYTIIKRGMTLKVTCVTFMLLKLLKGCKRYFLLFF